MDTEQQNTLEAKLKTYQEQARQYDTLLDDLRAKLSKADGLRQSEPQKRSHWNRVLDHLEDSLDLIKARREHCELRIQQITKELS